MNILVVDNGSFYLDSLIRLLPQSTVEVISYNKLLSTISDNYDVVILSGGHGISIVNHEANYEAELGLIRSIKVPLLGICLGCELIAFAYGAQLARMEIKEKGLMHLEITKPDPIFRSVTNMLVYESHRWAITEVGKELVPLAISKGGIEVFKHTSRPLYGFQFHPEAFVEETNGNILLRNFFHLVS